MKKNIFAWFPAWQMALVGLAVGTALLLACSQPVRARAMDWIRVLGGLTVAESSQSPLAAAGEGALPTTEGPAVSAQPAEAQPTVYSVPTQALPEALQNPPFAFSLPTWVPEDFTLDENVGLANSGDWINLLWNQGEDKEISLLVEREYNGYAIPVGVDSAEEIQIGAETGVLVRGFWDGNHQWDPTRGLALDWIHGGRLYHLTYSEYGGQGHTVSPIAGDVDAILQDLVRMAASIG